MTSAIRIKLDENLGNRGAAMFRDAGYDVATVFQQGLTSTADRALIDVCRTEDRCLVTLDLDFSNPLLFNPAEFAGIAVLRPTARPTAEDLLRTVGVLIAGLSRSDIRGKLWTVERGRIREYSPEEDERGHK